MSLRYRTAGESHGPALITLVEGVPSGVRVDTDWIDAELARRQGGYGRGARQRIETDRVRVLSGVRQGITLGSPIALEIVNADSRIDDPVRTPPVHQPRPGHADLAGSVKWLTNDCRGTLERASARETAARVAAGALAACMLREVGIEAFGYVLGAIDAFATVEVDAATLPALRAARDGAEVACPCPVTDARLVEHIHAAKVAKDTVGGLCRVHVLGCPIGLGSCVAADERLDARIAMAVMGIQAFKAVEIGLGRECALRFGSRVHDPISFDASRSTEPHLGYLRPTNHAGGLEGGMTNGMPVVVTGTMKPIATLLQGLPSVDLRTKDATRSQYERSDISAVAAASVVMQHAVGFEFARAFLEKFGGDSWDQVRASHDRFMAAARAL
jgi:chorismate synthase